MGLMGLIGLMGLEGGLCGFKTEDYFRRQSRNRIVVCQVRHLFGFMWIR